MCTFTKQASTSRAPLVGGFAQITAAGASEGSIQPARGDHWTTPTGISAKYSGHLAIGLGRGR
ncbi:hypothetical protein BD292_003430 [Rhodococcus percolatus]|nr:hypothetical protein [Rhodococcus opacus]